MHYWFEMPNKFTFEMPKVRRFILNRCNGGRILFPFAGPTRFPHLKNTTYIDINPDMNPDIVCDAKDILDHLEQSTFDLIISDPPYSAYQANISYDCEKYHHALTIYNMNFDKLLKVGGYFIQLGYSSSGMGRKRGYDKTDLAIVCLGGHHNDILISVERKTQHLLSHFITENENGV